MSTMILDISNDIRPLARAEIEAVTGGMISRGGIATSTSVVMGPNGETCTDPRGPKFPFPFPYPRGPKLPF